MYLTCTVVISNPSYLFEVSGFDTLPTVVENRRIAGILKLCFLGFETVMGFNSMFCKVIIILFSNIWNFIILYIILFSNHKIKS